jgi:2,4-dienoyl-CoA reductase-like NADH-dependent reductase (Old Yellow Enzyme family)
VSVRISLSDIVDGGMTVDDAVEITRRLVVADSVSLITVTAGGYHDGPYNAIATSDREDGWLIDLTARVKQAAGEIPVCVVGGIQNPAQAEQVLGAGKARHGCHDPSPDRRPGMGEQGARRPRD